MTTRLTTISLWSLLVIGDPRPQPAASSARDVAMAIDSVTAMPPDDRVRLAEAFRLSASAGSRLWPDWEAAAFAVLLVTPEREFLVRHPRPTADFAHVGYDTLLAADVYSRPRVFSPSFLATFPAVGGVPTVVVGQAERTGLTSTRWVLTLLHEHVHQMQYAQPNYYAGVGALGLARGDTTGMWMVEYAFPYGDSRVQTHFAAYARALDSALAAPAVGASPARDPAAVGRAVAAARRELRSVLTDDDDRYLAFQLWQEGVARYTELEVARLAADVPNAASDAFRRLADYTDYAAAAAAIEGEIRRGCRDADLGRLKRIAFYPIGAATALVLDATAPGWRARYLAQPFSLDGHLP